MDEETINTLLKLYFDDDMTISLRQKAVHNAILFSEELEVGGRTREIKRERVMKEYEKIKKEGGEEDARKFLEFMREKNE